MNTVATTHARAGAFTLIEMVVSLSIISVVFLAMGSVMVLASKAVPVPNSSTGLALDAAELLQQFTSELEVATAVSVATDKGIAFTVPDRDGDGSDESIVYLWGGVSGGSLVRQYNGGTLVNIVPAVYEFSIVYDTVPVPQPDAKTESAEVLLDSYSSTSFNTEFVVTRNNLIGQWINPQGLPADAVDWNLTRVFFQAKKHSSSDGIIYVQIRTPTASNTPGSTVLESKTLYESSLLSDYQWVLAKYDNVRGIAPADEVCLVLQWQYDTEAASIRHTYLGGSSLLTSYDKGVNWSYSSNTTMIFYAYGTYSTMVPQPPITAVRSVTLTLNPGKTVSSRVRTAAQTLNLPEMP
jgi:prepilin-type N-terminal cleavage/methylation domain-containing protein